MSIIEKLTGFLNLNSKVVCSNITNISSRFGMFQIQAYKDGEDEYLVIMSREFFNIEVPIVYIHSNYHIHNNPNSNVRYATNGINSTLKMISSQGGLIVFHSKDLRDIDELLQKIGARKLEDEQNKMTKVNIPLSLKVYGREYQILGTILKNLKLPIINLISHDINLTIVIEKLGIEIYQRAEAVAYNYGKIEN